MTGSGSSEYGSPIMPVVTRAAVEADVPGWLELVPEAEPLFGPMPDFEDHLHRGVERRTAIVATDLANVLGAALLTRDEQPHKIKWLYVRHSRRRQGAGTALLERILSRWPTGEIEVVTFTEDTPGGQSACRLYEHFGFVYHGRADLGPDGASRDRFILRR